MTILKAHGLCKAFRLNQFRLLRSRERLIAVDDVGLSLEQGETLALVGESGSGKSTTARLVLRLIEPDAGEVIFKGANLLDANSTELFRHRRKLQIIFQDPHGSFDPLMSIGESLTEPLAIHFDLSRKERLSRGAKLLERVGMNAQHMTRLPRELSGGQLQRAAIARALMLEPEVIVCDECVSALDVSIRGQVLNLLLDLQREQGISFLFITHDLSLVKAFAHRVSVMRNGKIVETGGVEEIFHRPRDPYTRQLLDAMPQLPKSPKDVCDKESNEKKVSV